MTDERFAQFRQVVDIQKHGCMAVSGPMFAALLSECLDEIERLNGGIKSLLAKMDESKEHYGPP